MSRRWFAGRPHAVVALMVITAVVGGCGSTPTPVASQAPAVAEATPSAAASQAAAIVTPGPTPTPAATPSPTPTRVPVKTTADLIGAPARTVSAGDVTLASDTLQRYFDRSCASEWKKPTAAERRADREIACLAVMSLVYARFVAYNRSDQQAFDGALAVYQYAVGALGADSKAYFDGALAGIDAALAAPAPKPTALKKLSALASVAHRSVNASALHRSVRDAFATDLGTLLKACKGFDYPGAGMNGCFPFPLYQPEAKAMGERDLAPSNDIGAVAACEYSPKVGNVRPDAAAHNCGQAGIPFWMAYLATGKTAYWDMLVSIRDLLWSKGDGRYASSDMKEFVGCFSRWVLAPGTQSSCPD